MTEKSVTIVKRRRTAWIVLALLVLFLIGSAAGIFIFRNALLPGQQQRVINIFPFMENLLWRPPDDYTLPTPLPSTSEISPQDLLSATLELPTSQATEDIVEATPISTLAP